MVDRKEGSAHFTPVGEGHVNVAMDSGDYLHPQTSPVNPLPPRSLPDVKIGKMRNMRFDSGVADLDSVNSEAALQQKLHSGQPGNLKNYDYADYGGHQYEELPHSRASIIRQMSPDSDTRSEYQSSGGTVTAGTPSESGDTAAIVRNGEQRKRFNPLYDAMVSSSPSIYNKVKATKESHSHQQLRMLKVIVIILILISCLSLAISLYLVIVYTAGPILVKNLQDQLDTLQQNHSALYNKMKMLETLVSGNSSLDQLLHLSNQVSEMESRTMAKIDVLEKNLFTAKSLLQQNDRKIDSVKQTNSLWINSTEQQIILIASNFTSALEMFHQGIQDQLKVISKMPGPQGPPGVGNLSACFMKDFTSFSASSRKITSTNWVPTSEKLKTEVVMFGFCEVDGGTMHNLETKKLSNNYHQYRCSCQGSVQGVVDRSCKVNVWVCPRESFGGVS